jgi:hypothetical protein
MRWREGEPGYWGEIVWFHKMKKVFRSTVTVYGLPDSLAPLYCQIELKNKTGL